MLIGAQDMCMFWPRSINPGYGNPYPEQKIILGGGGVRDEEINEFSLKILLTVLKHILAKTSTIDNRLYQNEGGS